jgi:hypothetical protein
MTMRLCWLSLLFGLFASGPLRADAFDHYVNPVLDRLVEGKNVKEIKQLTPNLIVDNDRVLPRATSAFVVVRTNGARYAKLLVQAARQKVGPDKVVPILHIERYVTYKEGEERTVLTSGKNQSLYAGFRFSLDLGQVVPEVVGGDLRFVVDGDKIYTEPLGKAKLYLVTKHDPAVMPKKGAKFVMGDRFEPRYFNGTFKLYDDGRRSGKLILKVGDDGSVTGAYYSDKDGQKYDVTGKIGEPQHSINFQVRLPRTEQTFKGMLFTGDGKAIAGTSRLAGRESAFYAVRQQ